MPSLLEKKQSKPSLLEKKQSKIFITPEDVHFLQYLKDQWKP